MDLKRFKHRLNSQEITNREENRQISVETPVGFVDYKPIAWGPLKNTIGFRRKGKLSRILFTRVEEFITFIIQEVLFVSTWMRAAFVLWKHILKQMTLLIS